MSLYPFPEEDSMTYPSSLNVAICFHIAARVTFKTLLISSPERYLPKDFLNCFKI